MIFNILVLIFFFTSIQPFGIAQPNQSGYNVTLKGQKVELTTPIFDQARKLYLKVAVELLPRTSNPYINYSYYIQNNDPQTSDPIVFTVGYSFKEVAEYIESSPTSQDGLNSSEVITITNIGKEHTVGRPINSRGYHPFAVSTYTDPQDQVLTHNISLTSINDMFTLEVHIPEKMRVRTDDQADIEIFNPGMFFKVKIKNYQYTNPNSALSLKMAVVTPVLYNIDIVKSQQIYSIFKDFLLPHLNSTFHWNKKALIDTRDVSVPVSSIETNYASLELMYVAQHYSFTSVNAKSISYEFQAGFLNDNPFIVVSPNTTGSRNIDGGAGGLLGDGNLINIDLDPNAIMFGFQALSLAGLLGLIIYYLRKYWYLLLGFLVGIGVTIYLPSRKVTALQALHHETRKSIMDELHAAAENGILLQELKDSLNIPLTTLLWHLEILEDFQYITRTKIRKQIILISNDFLDKFDPRLKEFELSFLSPQGELFKQFILKKLQSNRPVFSLDELIKVTSWHKKTAQRNLRRLRKMQIITEGKTPGNYFIASKNKNVPFLQKKG